MSITALISGQAGLALVQGASPQLRSVGRRPLELAIEAGASWAVFNGCTDVRPVTVDSVAELDVLLRRSWAADRALQLTLLLLDDRECDEDRIEYASCVETLIVEPSVRHHLEKCLASAAMPDAFKVEQITLWDFAAPNLNAVLREISTLQPQISMVSKSFSRIGEHNLGGDARRKEAIRQSLIDDGTFLSLARGIAQEESLSFRRLELMSRYRFAAPAMTEWISALDPSVGRERQHLQNLPEIDDDIWDNEEEIAPSREAYEQVKAQINAIVQTLEMRDLPTARRLTDLLIANQRSHSTQAQIAKSLCKLAINAKRLEVPELQLEWSAQATQENPIDPITFGHLADALIGVGRYEEAYQALDGVESAGDRQFAETGRARILRAIGKPEDARAKCLAVAAEFENGESIEYAHIYAADALRDMGRHDEALTEYREITERWPLKPHVWEGLASLYVDIGNLDEALTTFGKAGSNSKSANDRARAKNGRALALKLAGRFDESIRLFEEVLSSLPNNGVALTGKADALRAAGRFDAALAACEIALERSPYSPFPVNAKGKLLKELGQLGEAEQLYASGRTQFPYDQQLISGAISVIRSKGNFELALTEARAALRSFPYNTALRLLVADLLSRTGDVSTSLATYDQVIGDHPRHGRALAGKAALLIKLGRWAEARPLLPDIRARTQSDWSRHLLRALLVQNEESSGDAAAILEIGIKHCPFAHQRRLIRSALAKLELDRGRVRDARRVIEEAPTQVSNVIALHVLAAAHRSGGARARYNEILRREGPAEIIELAREIARRHGIEDGEARQSKAWISRAESEVILFELAA